MRAPWWALVLAGCGAGQGRPGDVFDESQGAISMVRLEEVLRGVRVAAAPVAVGATREGVRGVPLGGGSPWFAEHRVDMRPEIASGLVVGVGSGELFALRATTGSLLWSRPVGGFELVGAGDDGEVTAVALASLTGRGSVLLAVGRDGQVLRQVETDKKLGQPAVVRGVAFLPWNDRFLTAYDLMQGREVARLVGSPGLSIATTERGALFFGSTSLVRFDERLSEGPAASLARAEIPPNFMIRRASMALPLATARALDAGPGDRARVYAAPAVEGPPGLAEGRYYAVQGRVAVGFRTDSDIPVWARVLPRSTAGGAWFRGGVALCDLEGNVSLLGAATGNVEAELQLGGPVRSCSVQGGDLARSESGAAAQPLQRQLAAVLRLSEPELRPLQLDIVALLGRLGDTETTEVILALCVDPAVPEPLIEPLQRLVAARRSGSAQMLEALRRLPSPGPARPPPVAALTEALVALNERQAAPLLLAHLRHPASEPDAARAAARGLLTLATPAELYGLRAFFSLRRADRGPSREVLLLVARTLLRLGGEGERDVREAAEDEDAPPGLREDLLALLSRG